MLAFFSEQLRGNMEQNYESVEGYGAEFTFLNPHRKIRAF